MYKLGEKGTGAIQLSVAFSPFKLSCFGNKILCAYKSV